MSNTPALTLVGTGDFSLIIGATEAPVAETTYDNAANIFGNVKEVTVMNEQEVKDHFGSYKGVRVLDRSRTTQLRKGYTLKLDEFDSRALQALFYAVEGTPTTAHGYDYKTFEPFTQPQSLQGYARIRMWDTEDDTAPRFIHRDFLAVVRFSGDFTLGEDFTEYELKVDVLSPVGEVLLRDAPTV